MLKKKKIGCCASNKQMRLSYMGAVPQLPTATAPQSCEWHTHRSARAMSCPRAVPKLPPREITVENTFLVALVQKNESLPSVKHKESECESRPSEMQDVRAKRKRVAQTPQAKSTAFPKGHGALK